MHLNGKISSWKNFDCSTQLQAFEQIFLGKKRWQSMVSIPAMSNRTLSPFVWEVVWLLRQRWVRSSGLGYDIPRKRLVFVGKLVWIDSSSVSILIVTSGSHQIFNDVSAKDSSGACRVAWLDHQDLQDMDKTSLAGLLKRVVFLGGAEMLKNGTWCVFMVKESSCV